MALKVIFHTPCINYYFFEFRLKWLKLFRKVRTTGPKHIKCILKLINNKLIYILNFTKKMIAQIKCLEALV